MADELLTVSQSYEADRLAVSAGTPSLVLMEKAGTAVADAICERWQPCTVAVLCGRGNNGGDGFVVARVLRARGWDVRLALLGRRDSLEGDAAEMARQWNGDDESVSPEALDDAGLVVDALFGAGLSRPLEGAAKEIAVTLNKRDVPVVAVDVPSGLHGDLGRPVEGKDGICVEADLTITFFRKKPAHVLMPGRLKCGEVIVADIGIPAAALATIAPKMFENGPALWQARYPWPQPLGQKYGRGHCVVVSGPAHATGAARLAARGALRIGAGLVSVASPPDALAVNASALTAIMVKPFAGSGGLAELLKDERLNAVVIGPGCGVGKGTQELVNSALNAKCVLDADALTSFQGDPSFLFHQLSPDCVLTPHEGEFERIFPGLLAKAQTRIEAARAAAATAQCIVLLKGPDTVIAAPDGRVAVNANAPPWLATAGAGDVLAGMIGGLLAQGMDSFDAACAGAWLHGEAANGFGIGLIAEDLPEMLPSALRALHDGHPAAG
jgi:ADP-dependent NAD(P)H-hydrate dehydratase / NAD(P)H-hydrate epimerase